MQNKNVNARQDAKWNFEILDIMNLKLRFLLN